MFASTPFLTLLPASRYQLHNTLKVFPSNFNRSQITSIFIPIANTTIVPVRNPSTNSSTFSTMVDPALLLVERAPSVSRLNASTSTLAVFLFHTEHHVLANLQLHLVRKLATNLVAVEVFVDGSPSMDMRRVAVRHQAELHGFIVEKHKPDASGSDRNTAIVNWALTTRAKRYLGSGTAILLLDGDVLPLSPFDSGTLLNSHDIVCRKHPGLFARFCWIGFICLGPELYSTIGDFDVSQTLRSGQTYDSGGKTVEFLLHHENASFSWMRETILLKEDKNLFWGAVDGDIGWIKSNFDPCDRCGPEIFISPFNVSNAVFYHMISATSEWRFGHLASRRQAIHDSIMDSPYGPNRTYSVADMIASTRKVQRMELIPFFGNLTCEKACKS
jgi:hypothetical protein